MVARHVAAILSMNWMNHAMKRFLTRVLTLATALTALSHRALAQLHTEDIWATGLPDAVSAVRRHVNVFAASINIIIALIVVVVAIALGYTVWRFRAKKNPEPSRTTHNVLLEVIWTLIPLVIVIGIAIPSLKLMYYTDRTVKPDLTLKVTGYQWYWGYSYPDQGIDEFSLNIIPNAEFDQKHEFDALRTLPTYQRLLSTYDLATGKPAFVVLPVSKNIRVLTTGNDVIHSFALPAFGVKKDAVPGRLNETWFNVEKTGIYYGQCSEICGINHAYMPIEIRIVEQADFDKWANLMKTDSAAAMDYIQNVTVQYAHKKIPHPHLVLKNLWQEMQQLIK